MAFELQRSAALIDIRDELAAVDKLVSEAASRVKRWTSSRRPLAGAEALGKLNMAGAHVGWGTMFTDHDSDVGGYPVASDLLQLLAAMTAAAVRDMPTSRRSPTRASAMAIEFIREALWRPDDPTSRSVAAQLSVSRTVPRGIKASFSHVAQVMFEAATGSVDVNPDRSIRLFLERR